MQHNDSEGNSGSIPGNFQSPPAPRGGVEDFRFQRSFLEARAELLQLLGASWAMCQVNRKQGSLGFNHTICAKECLNVKECMLQTVVRVVALYWHTKRSNSNGNMGGLPSPVHSLRRFVSVTQHY